MLINIQLSDFCARLTPGKTPFADEPEGISEIVERLAEFLGDKHQFIRGDTARSGFDGGNGLPVVETQQFREAILCQAFFLPQGLDPSPNQTLRHGISPQLR